MVFWEKITIIDASASKIDTHQMGGGVRVILITVDGNSVVGAQVYEGKPVI